MPRLTVGLPVYNSERYLAETLDSILGQTFRDFTITLSDNASTDKTAEICKEYAARDKRIRYYRQASNIGLFRNYDFVLSDATSEYFKWASSNDICAPTFFESCVLSLDANPDAVLCCPGTLLIDGCEGSAERYVTKAKVGSTDPIERYCSILDDLGLNNLMNGVIRTAAIKKTSLNAVYMASDVNMLGELALLGKMIELPEFLFLRRSSKDAMLASDLEHVASSYADEPRDLLRHPRWDYRYNQIKGVLRLPISTRTKLRLVPYLTQSVWADKRTLLKELGLIRSM